MRKHKGIRMARMAAIGVAAISLAGAVTMELWNALMPALFKLPVVGFWQALGLLLLSKLLFGSFGGRRGGHWGKARFAWDMTPEERERFREAMLRRHPGPAGCGPTTTA